MGRAIAGVAVAAATTAGVAVTVGTLVGNGGPDPVVAASHSDLPDPAESGKAAAAAKRAAAKAFTDDVREWTACVAEKASARGETPGPKDPFDPVAECGEHPRPHDYGLTGRPDGVGGGPPDGVPPGPPDGVPPGPPDGIAPTPTP